jgi:hypothetical protein
MRPLSALRRFANTLLTVNVYFEGSYIRQYRTQI